jgi:hypothetical protein
VPSLLIWNGYRFYFFSSEGSEPAHVHIDKSGRTAKFWLLPVALASNVKFKDNEINELERKVCEHQKIFLKAWHEYFKNHS